MGRGREKGTIKILGHHQIFKLKKKKGGVKAIYRVYVLRGWRWGVDENVGVE